MTALTGGAGHWAGGRFMYDGTEQQIAAGLFVTSVFLMGFLRIGPYFSLVLDSMQGISVAAQAATLFCKPPRPCRCAVELGRLDRRATARRAQRAVADTLVVWLGRRADEVNHRR